MKKVRHQHLTISLADKKRLETMSRATDRIKTSFVVVLVNLVSSAIGSLTTLRIANVLGKTNLGELAFAYVIGGFVSTFVIFGQDRTLVRELVHRPEQRLELVFGAAALNILLFVLSASVLFLSGSIVHKEYLPVTVIVIALAIAMQSLDLRAIYDVNGKIPRHSVFYLVQRALYFGLIWSVLVWLPSKFSLSTIAGAQLIAATTGLLLLYKWAWTNLLPNEKRIAPKKIVKAALSLAKRNKLIFLAAACAAIVPSLNQIVLRRTTGLAALGGYFACWQIVSLALLVASQLSRLGAPALAQHTVPNHINKVACGKVLVAYGSIMCFIGSLVAIPLIVAPTLTLSILYNQEYHSETSVMRIMGAYIVIYFVGVVASQFVLALRRERIYFVSVVAAGISNIVLCAYLIPAHQGKGAAISLLISHSIAILLYCLTLAGFFLLKKNRAQMEQGLLLG